MSQLPFLGEGDRNYQLWLEFDRLGIGHSIGDLKYNATGSPGTGWLLCDGSGVTTANPRLREKLVAGGNPYGTTGGNPRLPAGGKMLVGKGSGTFAITGATGGTETETLSSAQIPAHSHPISDPGHAHGTNAERRFDADGGTAKSYLELHSGGAEIGTDTSTTGITTTQNNTGGGGSHNNLPPYVVVPLYIYAGPQV